MIVQVPLDGGCHLVYADQFASTLCGRVAGRDVVTHRTGASKLSPCLICRDVDQQRYPDGASRRLLRRA
jgi:hypothetical protein